MESSLNMNTLANSLPTSNLANAEADLMNNFKAAAMSITTLYRSSLTTSKRAYNAGYAAACQDLLVVIQQGVSVGGASNEGEGGMTIGRVMDWVEARLEAIKTREEEEDEEEREVKTKGSAAKMPGPSTMRAPVSMDKRSTGEPEVPPVTSPTTSHSPVTQTATPQTHRASSMSPPPPVTRALLRSKSRSLKEPTHSSDPFSSTNNSTDPPLHDPAPLFAEVFPAAVVGSKRRHTVMIDSVASVEGPAHTFLSTNAGGSAGSGALTNRRRSKAVRGGSGFGTYPTSRTENANHNYHQTQGQHDGMDVEDDSGRERKRVSRR